MSIVPALIAMGLFNSDTQYGRFGLDESVKFVVEQTKKIEGYVQNKLKSDPKSAQEIEELLSTSDIIFACVKEQKAKKLSVSEGKIAKSFVEVINSFEDDKFIEGKKEPLTKEEVVEASINAISNFPRKSLLKFIDLYRSEIKKTLSNNFENEDEKFWRMH